MVVINSFEVIDGQNKGVKLNFDHSRKNLLIAKPGYGKTLLINLILTTLGSLKGRKSIFGANGIKSDVNSKIDVNLSGKNYIIEASISLAEKGVEVVYELTDKQTNVHYSFVSAEELTDYIFTQIKYPRYVTWDGMGRKTMLEDLIAPYFMNQDWSGGVGQALELSWKPANRIAVCLAYDSEAFKERLDEFYKNDELIMAMMNFNRLSSNKKAIISVLGKSVDNSNEDINSLLAKKINLENQLDEYKQHMTLALKESKEIASYRKNIDVLSNFILPSLSNKLGADVAKQVATELQNVWLSSIFDIKKSGNYSKFAMMAKSIREEIESLNRDISKISPSLIISKQYFEHIKSKVWDGGIEFNDNEISRFNDLQSTWQDLYSNIKSSYQEYMQKTISGKKFYIVGFNIDPTTFGTNKQEFIVNTLSFLKEQIAENTFYIWDSIFQNDGNDSESHNEAERRFSFFNSLPVNRGIFTSSTYNKSVADEMIVLNKDAHKIINIEEPNLFSTWKEYI